VRVLLVVISFIDQHYQNKDIKGKGKQIYQETHRKHETQEGKTMDKVIAMITQIASRLEAIETNMGNIPNRS
jgi:hypothetical protein